jgi:hypothetical protein
MAEMMVSGAAGVVGPPAAGVDVPARPLPSPMDEQPDKIPDKAIAAATSTT